MSPAGYKLYKNGRLLAEREGKPFSSQSGRLALGVSAWDLKSGAFQGDMAQVRLSFAQLKPGNGTGRGELAWAASLEPAKLVRPTLEWLPSPLRLGNLFMCAEKPFLTLRVRNRFYEPLKPMTLTVSVHDEYMSKDLAPVVVKIDEAMAPRSNRDIEVDLGITRAGVYKVTAAGPGGSRAQTQSSLILGPRPEDDPSPVPFFGNSSHTRITEYEYQLRREFGSRAERGSQVLWGHLQKRRGEFLWKPIDEDPIKTIALATSSAIFGYTGYTPQFASTMPDDDDRYDHDVPDLKHYVAWLEAAARHYHGVIDYWEVWNEPNGCGFLEGSAERLADLHKAAALAVKRVDPRMKIVGASLVGIDPKYMDRLLDAGAVDYMHVIAFHNYCWDYPPDRRIVEGLKRISAWRDRYAPGRPLWDDEWAPYVKQRENPVRYANWTARQLILTKAMGIQHSDCYTWNGHPNRLWFDGHWPTPAAIAYRTTAQLLTGAMPTALVSNGEDGVYAFVFKRPDELILVGWTSRERQEEALPDVPVLPGNAVVYDLMGNPAPVEAGVDRVSLKLTNGPVFLRGVAPAFLKGRSALSAPANEAPPARHPSLWYSFHYPKGSEVSSLPLGTTREIRLRVHNDGDEPVTGRLSLSSDDLKLSTARLEVTVQARSTETISFQASAPKQLTEGIHQIRIDGLAEGLSCGRMQIRCYVAAEEVMAFHMATWEMTENMTKAEKTGQGIHIRWVEPGGFMEFRFDLTDAASARLLGYMDSVSPALTDGGNFRLRASSDGKKWSLLLEGTGEFAWREIDLTPYVGKPVFVRFESSPEKGQARLRQMRLMTVPK